MIMMLLGTRGPDVLKLQNLLLDHGFDPGPLDGWWGQLSDAALRRFQAARGLDVDGIPGPLTMAALALPNGSTPKPAPEAGPWVKGIDVSGYQPGTDWAQVAAAGYAFAFIKATEGNWNVDSEYAYNYEQTKAHGILRSASHFFRAGVDGKVHADWFLKHSQPGDFPAVLDLEVSDNHPTAVVIERAQDFLDAVESATGRRPIIYTGLGFMGEIGNPAQFAAYPLWCAQYNGRSQPSPVPPWAAGGWTFWQWSGDQLRVPGVATVCDLNWFNGSLDELHALAGV